MEFYIDRLYACIYMVNIPACYIIQSNYIVFNIKIMHAHACIFSSIAFRGLISPILAI